MDDLDAVLGRARGTMPEKDLEKLRAAIETLDFLAHQIQGKNASIAKLRKMIFGTYTEKTKNVAERIAAEQGRRSMGASSDTDSGDGDGDGDGDEEEADPEGDKPGREKARGHGRNPARAYVGATRNFVSHESHCPGDVCPRCQQGKLHEVPPGIIVRLCGQAPIAAEVTECQKLRCATCGIVFTAKAPDDLGPTKYKATAASMIALLKYGSGVPFNRLERVEKALGIPLPSSTQWEVIDRAARLVTPAFEELVREGAQGQIIHNDDTGVKILEFMGHRRQRREAEGLAEERRGLNTSGIIACTEQGRKIALFFSGPRHAGENLEKVLSERSADAPPPIQMCDGLAANAPRGIEVILANCLAHGRRKFVELEQSFPGESLHLLKALGEVYQVDARARDEGMTPPERLALHRRLSRPKMIELRLWMRRLLREKEVEPNSLLGKAFQYMTRRWANLTRFYRTANAPLDNNLCERGLKRAILHRKNALFYRTQHGANTGDIFMSLIHTCELNKVNPFTYLTALQEHSKAVKACPGDWLPWNHQATLAILS